MPNDNLPGQQPPASPADQTVGAQPQGGAEHPAGAGAQVPPDGQQPPQQVAAPWAETKDGLWQIGDQPWYGYIPEDDVRKTIGAKGYKNPAEVSMAYHNLLKLQNGNPNVVALPGENATPDEMNAFYTKLGRPETPDGYQFEFGEGVQLDENMLKFGRELFHEIGLDGKRAQAAANKWNEFANAENQRLADEWRATNEKEVEAYRASLGDKFDAAIEAGRRVVNGAGLSAETIQKVEASIGTAGVLELLGAIGMSSQEGGFVGAGTGTGAPPTPDQMTPEQAQSEISKLMGDAEFQKVYNDKNAEGHQAAVDRMAKLYSRL